MSTKKKSPVREYRTIMNDSGNPGYVNRIMIATPATGVLRVEWVQARYGQSVPVNWSQVQLLEFLDGHYPLRYQVADAQNIIVQQFIHRDFEWLLLWEHDVIPRPEALTMLNRYMAEEKVPVVSGLYFTRSNPSEPLVFKEMGIGPFYDFKLGQKVWCKGVPTGFLLVHRAVMKSVWDESPEYLINKPSGQVIRTRRVFESPREYWHDPESWNSNMMEGTSDLNWCTRVIEEGHFKKAGWDSFQRRKYPFLIDTKLLCGHINLDGSIFPPDHDLVEYQK